MTITVSSIFGSLLLSLCVLKTYQAPTDLPFHATLDHDGQFQIYWSYDNDSITIEYHAKTQGWAGLGFSPSGGMSGADIAVFWRDGTGKGQVSDRHGPANGNGYPPEDAHQDYNLFNATKNDTHLIVRYSRKRMTCDADDWPLGDDTVRVIYAANDAVPKSNNDFQQHTVRGAKSLHFFDNRLDTPDGVPPETGATSMEFHVKKVQVPDNTDTLYYCEFMQMPKIEKKKQVIKAEPVIVPENLDIVHHMIVFKCPYNATKFLGPGTACFDQIGERAEAIERCTQLVLSAWAVGGQSVTYPDNAGIPLYNPNEDLFVLIEMHYDNSKLSKGRSDTSGMRFWLTEKLRPIEVGQATFGVTVNPLAQILPPKVPEITNYGYCTAQATANFPETGIKMIGGVLHTHLAGRKIRFRQFRKGVELPMILDDEHYDFSYQDRRTLKTPVTVLPGDDLVVECVYETMDRDNTTFGGLASHDEMCLIYADYIPAINEGFLCLSWPDQKQLLSIFSDYLPDNGTLASCGNDTVKNCLKTHKWTQDEIRKLQDVDRNGTHTIYAVREFINVTDKGNETVPVSSIFQQKGYPTITTPLVVPNTCTTTPPGNASNPAAPANSPTGTSTKAAQLTPANSPTIATPLALSDTTKPTSTTKPNGAVSNHKHLSLGFLAMLLCLLWN